MTCMGKTARWRTKRLSLTLIWCKVPFNPPFLTLFPQKSYADFTKVPKEQKKDKRESKSSQNDKIQDLTSAADDHDYCLSDMELESGGGKKRNLEEMNDLLLSTPSKMTIRERWQLFKLSTCDLINKMTKWRTLTTNYRECLVDCQSC